MKESGGGGYGSATLLMLFSVLCLTVFAVLAFCSARADLRLSEHFAAMVAEYYAADAEATRIMAQLDAASDVDAEIERLSELGVEFERDGERLSYACPVDDALNLCVTLERLDSDWRVLSWKLEDIGGWNADNHLNVFQF